MLFELDASDRFGADYRNAVEGRVYALRLDGPLCSEAMALIQERGTLAVPELARLLGLPVSVATLLASKLSASGRLDVVVRAVA